MPPRPTVAFVDDETWLSFVDLAAGLRSRGVRVVRVTARMPTFEGRLVQRLEGLAFGRTRVGAVDRHTGSIDLVALDAVLSDDVIDVVVQDPLVPELLGPGQSRADQSSRVRAGVDPRVLVDKHVQSQVAASAGVAVPREWTEPVSSHGRLSCPRGYSPSSPDPVPDLVTEVLHASKGGGDAGGSKVTVKRSAVSEKV